MIFGDEEFRRWIAVKEASLVKKYLQLNCTEKSWKFGSKTRILCGEIIKNFLHVNVAWHFWPDGYVSKPISACILKRPYRIICFQKSNYLVCFTCREILRSIFFGNWTFWYSTSISLVLVVNSANIILQYIELGIDTSLNLYKLLEVVSYQQLHLLIDHLGDGNKLR